MRIYSVPAPSRALICRYSLLWGKRKSSDLVSEIRFPQRGKLPLQTLSDWQKGFIYKWIHDIFYPAQPRSTSGEYFLLSSPFLMIVISALLFLVILHEDYFSECKAAWLFPQHWQQVRDVKWVQEALGSLVKRLSQIRGGSTHKTLCHHPVKWIAHSQSFTLVIWLFLFSLPYLAFLGLCITLLYFLGEGRIDEIKVKDQLLYL